MTFVAQESLGQLRSSSGLGGAGLQSTGLIQTTFAQASPINC